MITKLLDSRSFSKVWKTAVRPKFCSVVSKTWSRNIISRPLRGHILFTYPTNSLQALRKNYIGFFELRLKTCEIGNCMKCFIPSCFPQLQKYRSRYTILLFSIAGLIEASVLEVITSRKLQHVLHSYKREAFQKVNYKLDLIQQPYLDKIHSR